MLRRRTFMTGFSSLALAGGDAFAKANFAVPDGACDCHHHIYDPERFAYQPDAMLKPAPHTVADYRKLQHRLGTSRNIIVTPSTYGTDNRCSLDALRQLGKTAFGVAVVHADLPQAQLKALHTGGVRGVRIQFGRGPIVGAEEIEPLAKRIQPLGWHMQFNTASGDELVALGPVLQRLPVPLVIDHLGHVPMPQGRTSSTYRLMRRLLDSGRCWVKLSAPYTDSITGGPDYADTSEIARDYVRFAPERVVWASNWPFPALPKGMQPPDALAMLNILESWAPDTKTRHRILVENPEALYGFDPRDRPKAFTGP
jgi:D-galactarolactone isomerase